MLSITLDLEGIVVEERDAYKDAVTDVTPATEFYIETFGTKVLGSETFKPDF